MLLEQIKELIQQIKQVNNEYQYGAFICLVCLLLTIVLHNIYLIVILGIVALLSGIIFFYPLINKIFENFRSKDWNKSHIEYMKSYDYTMSPAYVAANNYAINGGKKSAYEHVLEEIEELKKTSLDENQKLTVLEERIKGSINSIK